MTIEEKKTQDNNLLQTVVESNKGGNLVKRS